MNNHETPVRCRYHLRLSRRRGFNLDPTQYSQLKEIGLIVDIEQSIVKEGGFNVLRYEASLNRHIASICTAGELTDNYGHTEAIIFVLREFQEYVHPDVARELRSRLGDLIKNRVVRKRKLAA